MTLDRRYFTETITGWNVTVCSELADRRFIEAMSPFPQDCIRGPFEKLESSKHAVVSIGHFSIRARAVKVVCKQFLPRCPVDLLKDLFRPSRARRAFDAHLMLEDNGIESPRAFAVAERQLSLRGDSFFIAEFVGRDNVYRHLAELKKADTSGCLLRIFLTELGSFVGKMHRLSIAHGDLRPGNILARESDGKWSFCLVDNERTRKHNKLPEKSRVKNLMQINMLEPSAVSRADRLRFFRAYIEENPMSRKRQKQLIAKVLSITNRRLKEKGRKAVE